MMRCKRAYASRSDYQAAMADVRAAEFSRKAAVAGYFPSLSFNADYGAAGSHPSTATSSIRCARDLIHSDFSGQQRSRRDFAGRCETHQSRDRLANLRGQIDADVRTALLNLQSSAEQVEGGAQ